MHFAYCYFELKNYDFAAGAPECSSCATFVLKKRDFTPGAAGMLFPYHFCTWKLRISSRSCGSALCALALYVNVATAQPEMREGASHLARRHSESASTRTISADGSPSSRHIRAAPQRERFDKHDLRRRFAEIKTHSHGATARALRHARSPQKVRRDQDTFARRHGKSASTRTISTEGSPSSRPRGATARALRHAQSPQRACRAQDTFARRSSESASTGTISAESSPRSRHIRMHGATARALRHARFPQRVRRAQDTFARRHSKSASTGTISAEGSPSSRHIRAAPQQERFDRHDLRRGFAELKTHLHGAMRKSALTARSPQNGIRRVQGTCARRHSESASTRRISAEGSPSSRHIRTAPQRESPCSRHICMAPERERFDTHNLRRGFAELVTHSHGITARALRLAQSPPRSRHIRKAPQRERIDAHDLRKGFTFVLQRLK